MSCLVLGAGLVGSQVVRILVERGERAREVLGYAPRYSMREAVRDLAAWLERRNPPARDLSHHLQQARDWRGPEMNTADISALARHLFETQGAKAIAEAAQKAASFEEAGDEEQAKFWRRVEAVLFEIRGPRQG